MEDAHADDFQSPGHVRVSLDNLLKQCCVIAIEENWQHTIPSIRQTAPSNSIENFPPSTLLLQEEVEISSKVKSGGLTDWVSNQEIDKDPVNVNTE